MRYAALAVDYDGTLARDGRVDDATAAALARLRASGRRPILVTGRELPDLLALFPQVTLFDLVVAENGALLFWPATREEKLLAEPPPQALVTALAARGVAPMSVGRVVVATWQPHEATVLEVVHDLGLEHQLIFNKGALMVLPPTVNKGTGLAAALGELRLSPHNAVAVGDAENDHALFTLAECAVAVANALPMVKERADLVTAGDHGAGVVEVIDKLIADDLSEVETRLRRHDVLLGHRLDGEAVHLPAFGTNVLIAGSSGSGKSTIVAGLIERLGEVGYQCCVVDPEGDYDAFARAVVVGDWAWPPPVAEVVRVLEQPDESVVVGLLGVPLAERPGYFAALRAALAEQRGLVGRPHWLVLDEAHHLLPRWGGETFPAADAELGETILATVDPSHLAATALARVGVVIATGTAPAEPIAAVCATLGERPPAMEATELPKGEALVWRRGGGSAVRVRVAPPRRPHRRHRRKYALGELEPDRSFFFRGPAGTLDLRATSLLGFLELADQVDDEVWFYHLRRGDVARWFREVIRDEELAGEATRGEALADAAVRESRAIIRRAIEHRYTLPP